MESPMMSTDENFFLPSFLSDQWGKKLKTAQVRLFVRFSIRTNEPTNELHQLYIDNLKWNQNEWMKFENEKNYYEKQIPNFVIEVIFLFISSRLLYV